MSAKHHPVDLSPDLYERDFYAWTRQQAARLRAGELAGLDLPNLAEEIESMGRSERRELINRLAVLLAHLLKWQVQPDRRHLHAHSWRATIELQRLEVAEGLQDNPSLRYGLEDRLAEAYRKGVLQAVKDTGLSKHSFPSDCPFTLEQVLDQEYWPD